MQKQKKSNKKFFFKNIAIAYRPNKPLAFKMAKSLVNYLINKKIKSYTFLNQKIIPNSIKINSNREMRKIDLVVVLGGDGTYLRAARELFNHPIPVLGINLGSLGFLTNVRKEDLYQAIDNALKGDFYIRCRSLLDAKLIGSKCKIIEKYTALNDFVIERGNFGQLIGIKIKSDNLSVMEFKGDGLIVSTPTGSTAYNLSAGGPVIHPRLNAIVITPICPHSLTAKPIIISDEYDLEISLSHPKQKAFISVDGRRKGRITFENKIKILKNNKTHLILRQPRDNFFSIIREKLKFG